jgi:2-C-methyl-D-erythritol 4-phosphate cytidylyltransferase
VADRIWFLIAAAGRARRFGGRVPKPYLKIAGKTLLEHSLRTLAAVPGVAGGVVVLASGDRRFQRLPRLLRRCVVTATGGPTRAWSVLNGLQALGNAAKEDWVLVHDAARPCLSRKEVDALIAECRRDPVGGLLAIPITDTVKQADEAGRSSGTLPRERLWRAQTPQMFRHGQLVQALTQALEAKIEATDEAAAIEGLGLKPRLVEGSPLNIKVTRPADFLLAQAAMRVRGTRK